MKSLSSVSSLRFATASSLLYASGRIYTSSANPFRSMRSTVILHISSTEYGRSIRSMLEPRARRS